MPENFRFVLRDQTQAQHERVDAALSGLDLTEAGDYGTFLKIHVHCFAQMQSAVAPGGSLAQALGGMVRRATGDLAALGQAPGVAAASLERPVEPLAASYVVEGSRLGSRVLARQWAEASDSRVRGAGAYLSHPHPTDGWRAVCDRLALVEPGSPLATTVLADTRRLFYLFLDATRHFGERSRQDAKV